MIASPYQGLTGYRAWHFISKRRVALWMVLISHAAWVRHLPSHLLPAQTERMWGSDSSRKEKQQRESLRYIGPEINCGSFTGRRSRSQNSGFHFCPRARSVLCVCVCVCVWVCAWRRNSLTHKVSSTVSHTRLTRLSASGSPYYINGKCSVEDNTHMVGCDERWHPARD